MNSAEVSDLEEGEILEYDGLSTNHSRSEFGMGRYPVESSIKGNKNGHFRFCDNKDWYLPEQRKDDYINVRLKEKINFKERRDDNPTMRMADLESISSEGEYKSDEDDKYSAGENEYYKCSNGETRKREKNSAHFYGTVEDIMSEIGETICRKSRCNYKKRKSKESKLSLDKCSNSSYDAWRSEIFSSHLKSKRHKRKGSVCDSESELGKYRTERRKKRKKREVYYGEEETVTKKLKLRDFDEMRRQLMEKLKKQKAEEALKESANETPLELENSEIQEIDMLVDCTNYVDNPREAPPDDSANEGKGSEEKDGEDELDLIQLRLIALASNKKRKIEEAASNTEKSEDFLPETKPNSTREDGDLDRNELLLRAEALKTALLKKHQRRLNKLKVGETSERGNSSINNFGDSSPPVVEKVTDCTNLESGNGRLDADYCKENVEREGEREGEDKSCSHPAANSQVELEKDKPNTTALPSGVTAKKTCSRAKTKRKKRKSASFANNLKENNEKSEALEEDDHTLRTQLLSDLMKKKSLKDVEKKSVLMDSVQTAANKPSPSVTNTEPPKENSKPVTGVKKNLLSKINLPKTKKSKAAVLPKFPKPEIQRIIVHLGSEDSSDEDCAFAQPPKQTPPQEKVEDKGSAITESSGVNSQAGEVIQAKYERSVELLLSQARKKIEGEKRITASTLATPEAVYKHLPPSQRLEYMRLKQKIAERENLRKQKENSGNPILSSEKQPVQNSTSSGRESLKSVSQKSELRSAADSSKLPKLTVDNSSSHKNGCGASNPEAVKNVQSGSNNVGGLPTPNGVKTRRLIVNKLKDNSTGKSLNARGMPLENGLKTAALTEHNLLLLPSSQALLSKLKLLLKKIKIEKMIEENYEKEISKLKNQINLFEKKKCEQRFKIKKIWEEGLKTYNAIQGITGKAKEKAVAKESEGAEQKIDGGRSIDEGKEPVPEKEEIKQADEEEGKKVSHEPETEISKAESASDKELKNDDKISETITVSAPSGPCPMKYDSPLQVFSKVSDCATRVDPNVMVCQFDLMGVCKDEECTYQHLRILAK